jgi:accessory colonization factor AcfC
LTDQETAVFATPETVAMNCLPLPTGIVREAKLSVTDAAGCACTGGAAVVSSASTRAKATNRSLRFFKNIRLFLPNKTFNSDFKHEAKSEVDLI